MERNKAVETSQPVQEDNLFKHTGFSGNFPIGSTKNMCSIYFLSGITGIFMSMVNNHSFAPITGNLEGYHKYLRKTLNFSRKDYSRENKAFRGRFETAKFCDIPYIFV